MLKRKNANGKETHAVKTEEDTFELAADIADGLKGGEVILLNGELGAGKTTFTKGLAKALGITDEVTSPTFTILNVYEGGRLKLNHLDMYRLENSDEVSELGLEDSCFGDDAVTVIEWNKFENFTGKVIEINISQDGDGRIFEIVRKEAKACEENILQFDEKADVIDEKYGESEE